MSFKRSLILASGSPRRQALMRMAGYRFTVVEPAIDECYTGNLPVAEVAGYLAKKKAMSVKKQLLDDEIILAADTTVILGETLFGKPASRDDAIRMLTCLSGKTHTVITGVCLRGKQKVQSFTDRTTVVFRKLEQEEILYYVDNFHPFDKAGGYGIQEWIGLVGIEAIRGCYFNVVGLPIPKVYACIQKF